MAKVTSSEWLSQFDEPTPETQPTQASQWVSQFEEPEEQPRRRFEPKLSSETLTGKAIGLYQDIALGTAGSIAGATIGQTLIPIPGVGAFVGGVVGGAGGAVVSKGLHTFSDYVERTIMGRELKKQDIAKNLANEALISAGTDVAVQTALAVAPPAVRATAKGVGKMIPESVMADITKRARSLKKLDVLSKTSEKLKRTMTKINDEMALTQINHDSALRKAERKAMEVGERVETAREIPTEIKENMDGLVDNILSQRADTIKGLVEPFSKSLDLSGKEFNTMYNEIKEVFGDNGINIFDEIVSLNKAVDAVGLDAFDTATVNKINKLNGLLEERIAVKTNQIAKSAVPGPTDFQAVQPVMPKATKDVFNVSEAIAMKQDMFDISRSIFEKKGGSAVKSGIGQDINQIIDSLDNKINRATGGASSEVNTAYNGYKTIQNVTKSIVKDFKGELGDEVGGRLSDKQIGRVFTGYFDSLTKLDKKTVKRIIDGDESLSNYASSTIDKMFELPNALIYTGNPELAVKGQQMFEQLNELHNQAFNVVNLNQMADDALKANADYIKKVQRETPDIKGMKLQFADELEPVKRELAESQIRINNMREQGIDISKSLDMSKRVLEVRYTGLAAANLAASTGNLGVASAMRALTYMASMSKFSPTLANAKLGMAKRLQSLVSLPDVPFETKVVVSKAIRAMIPEKETVGDEQQ